MLVTHDLTSASFGALKAALPVSPRNTIFRVQPDAVFSVTAADCTQLPLVLSNSDFTETKNTALLLDGAENVTLDFQGAMLECEGKLLPAALLNCKNVNIRNLVIDWKYPLSAEGTIVRMTEQELDLKIDPVCFPWEISAGRLYFPGNGDPAEIWESGHTVFHPQTGTVCMKNGDSLNLTECTALDEDTVRFTGTFPEQYPVGAVVVLRHSGREHAGIFAENCQNLCFENVTIHATGGLGILCQYSKDLTFRNIRFCANTSKGRRIVCGHDDGLHLTCNSGAITIENCYFYGLMDDPVNVHGLCARIDEVENPYTVIGRFVHPQARGFRLFARTGDIFSLIRSRSMASVGTAVVKSFTLLNTDTFRLEFSSQIPDSICSGDALENLTNTPSLLCRNNFFGSCRARGVLVSTPKPVVIENNWFQSAGCAILLAGDANDWYESGACCDVSIRKNHFTPETLSTRYQGCEGIISICPSVPEPGIPFHKNITIEDNDFCLSGGSAVYAFSAENLNIQKNRMIQSTYVQKIPGDALIRLKCCRSVSIRENILLGELKNPRATIDLMQENEVASDLT